MKILFATIRQILTDTKIYDKALVPFLVFVS
jgi:hypothetical protein